MLFIWDVSSGEFIEVLHGHLLDAQSFTFSTDDKLVASSSEDGTIRIWDLATGKEVEWFHASDSTEGLSFTANDLYLDTNIGRFSIGSGEKGSRHMSRDKTRHRGQKAEGEVSERLGYGIEDNTWITVGGPTGRRLLWLPPDFRPTASATLNVDSGSVIVIGCSSGRMVIIGPPKSSLLNGL